ncbi:MAG: hypothetical protein UT61_C0062G0011 [Candidatus Woesebacteria bacterium GW2011_GWA1_39_8]|uniref:Uncharacterized protein n=1 Tax=Candidatus Woesebacteria bacterium GW2011_GWA1_39_8 TaxID=1618552 RepID=A0A0G0PS24_9BACT|nr:MAG: hypothetical protein UT61_C0062G0011 [Candidatus Woesebacteria bacterium GW2011_GWA1_39_8]
MEIVKNKSVIILKPKNHSFVEFVGAVEVLAKEYGDRKILYIFTDDKGDIVIILDS